MSPENVKNQSGSIQNDWFPVGLWAWLQETFLYTLGCHINPTKFHVCETVSGGPHNDLCVGGAYRLTVMSANYVKYMFSLDQVHLQNFGSVFCHISVLEKEGYFG